MAGAKRRLRNKEIPFRPEYVCHLFQLCQILIERCLPSWICKIPESYRVPWYQFIPSNNSLFVGLMETMPSICPNIEAAGNVWREKVWRGNVLFWKLGGNVLFGKCLAIPIWK